MLFLKSSFYAIVKESIQQFYAVKKVSFTLLLLLIFISSLIDVVSISVIIPVVYLINDASPIYTNPLLSYLYNAFSFSSSAYFILFLLIGLVVLIAFKNLLLLVSVYFQNKFIYSVAFLLVGRQMDRFYKSDYLDVKSKNSMEYLRYLAEAPQVYAVNILLPLTLILSELLVVFFISIALLVYSPLVLLLVALSVLPVGFLLIRSAKNRMMSISDKKGEYEKDTYKAIVEGISAYSDIKLFQKEGFFINRIKNKFKRLYDVNAETNLYHWVPRRIIETLVIFTICVLYAIVTFLLLTSSVKLIIILLAFATAVYRLLPSVNEILVNVVKVKTSCYALEQLSLIKEPLVLSNDAELMFEDQIEWKGINFNYTDGSKSTLTDINWILKKGHIVVLSGESGSGKTTLGKLLTGFIKPDSGKILIDNIEVQHFNQIKHLVAYVTQDFYLLDKSLVENIALGEEINSINLNKIEEILQAVNLTDFIKQQPLGIYQPIGEMGAKISGGQKQRIAIARCLYKNAKILVLDEATSSLDAENETEILNTIYSIAKQQNMLVLIITHRVSSVKNFDELYLLENGKLKQQSV